MNRTNPTALSFVYVICTLISIIVWIISPNLSYYIGAASIIQLFVFAVGSGNKYIFVVLSIIILILALGLVIAVRSAHKKRQYKMLTVLMWVDVIISAFLLAYSLAMQNYIDTVYHVGFGMLIRCLFAICFSWKANQENASS